MIAYLSPELKTQFIDLIAKQTGIEVRSQNMRTFKENIELRVKELRLQSPEAYYNLLANPTVESEREWQEFVCLMTNKESYFFRDKGQIALLSNHILPELIERKKSTRSIRICSAGCSTGQEPYSIAILLQQLLPDIERWQIKIYGIDINKESLAVAQQGNYNEWSFRVVQDDIKQRYFRKVNNEYYLNEDIKKMVKFRRVNLVKDMFPSDDSDISDMDLVICRNVFIYFVELAIIRVLEKFYNTLQPFGYLMTGHAEVAQENLKRFQTKLFPESIIYQRPSESLQNLGQGFQDYTHFPNQVKTPNFTFNSQNTTPIKNIQQPLTSPFSFSSSATIKPQNSTVKKVEQIQPKIDTQDKTKQPESKDQYLQEILDFIKQKSYFLAIPRLEKILAKSPYNSQAHCLLGEIYANMGKYKEAIESCNNAISADSLITKPYYLLGQIADEQGNLAQAKQYFNKVIYLDPNAVYAYYKLANIYQQEGNYERRKKMQQSTLKILQSMPENTLIPEINNMKVSDLIAELENKLN